MIQIDLPSSVRKIIETLNNASYDAYIVGGCVRDSLLGKTPNDWDITTSALPNQVKSLFKRTIDTGILHGTVTVLCDGGQYEITTYRIDGEYLDGRHPKSVIFTGKLALDLERRDFTINAMAYHPDEGLIDLFGGEEDLKNGIIKCVGNPLERFSEDALRMMRAIRFSAQLGFTIDSGTFGAIEELAPSLEKISAERIREEMLKTIVSDNPMYFRMYYESGLSKVFMPEFDLIMNTPQKHPHHMYSVGEHTLHSLDNVGNDRILRLCMLFHDIAKPLVLTIDEDGLTHFFGHQKESGRLAGKIMDRLKFDNDTKRLVCLLVENHDIDIQCTEKSVRRAVNKLGETAFPLLLRIKTADALAQSEYMRQEKLDTVNTLQNIFDAVMEKRQCTKLSDLAVSGKDLINNGIEPGRKIGEILNRMLEDVLDNPENNNKEYLLRKYVFTAILVLFAVFPCLSLYGCDSIPKDNTGNEASQTEFTPASPGNFDSEDTAVITGIDSENGTISFRTLAIYKYYTLSYDGATSYFDKYDQPISLSQLSEGDIVTTRFMKSRKRLDSISADKDAFKLSGITEFEISPGGHKMTIGNISYTLSDKLTVTGEQGIGSAMDINKVDEISVSGYDHNIIGIHVERGHGYLKLSNDSFFIGGWLEANGYIYPVSEDMLVPVPSGTVRLCISNDGMTGEETVNISPNEEFEWNVSRWQGEVKQGQIIFTVTPGDATVYVDSEKRDISLPLPLDYGIHQLIVVKNGYQTVSKYIKVGSESANIDIVMEKNSNENVTSSNTAASENKALSDDKAISDNLALSNNEASENGEALSQNIAGDSEKTTANGNEAVPAPSNNEVFTKEARVYINEPDGAEVYVDGQYVGLVPTYFKKSEGSKVITLRKSGYQTRSYTLELDASDTDVNYSFSELLEIL